MSQRTKSKQKLSKEIKSDNYCCRNSEKSDRYIGKQYRKEAMSQSTKRKQKMKQREQ